MNVGRFSLPKPFVNALESGLFQRKRGSWELKRNTDAFGNRLETEIADVYCSVAAILEAGKENKEDFPIDEHHGVSQVVPDESGAVADVTDFDAVVEFATSADGSPFCFDFRTDPDNPSVVWWNDWYWRRVAPDFDSFIALFNFSSGEMDGETSGN